MTGKPPLVTIPKPNSYRGILGEAAWQRLHPDIRKRFDHNQAQRSVCYEGTMEIVDMSGPGALLAQACRLIGTPLALHRGNNIPTVVDVYPNLKLNGMTWDRLYAFNDKPANRVRSTKCIQADAGLVEVVGYGFGMYLRISEKHGAIVFKSRGFFCKLKNFKFSIPNWLSPGKTTVTQTALSNGYFTFELNVQHMIWGRMFWQHGTFKEKYQGERSG